jgi:hypothetical protein
VIVVPARFVPTDNVSLVELRRPTVAVADADHIEPSGLEDR